MSQNEQSERPKKIGRPKGAVNKITADVRALAREYGPAAIRELYRLATTAESEAARVAAIKELLDRGYGRSAQPVIGGADDDPAIRHQGRIEIVIVDPATNSGG
jgi:hypothetical protein